MDFIQFSIRKPVSILVGVILVALFGVIGLLGMPYQLSPTVTEPEITVRTSWTGATPYEIERDIIEEQEKALKGVSGLQTMESTASNGQGEITLRFSVGTDLDDAVLRVSNKLDEVPSYPENVDRPIISATGASASPIIWMVLKTLPDNPKGIDTYRTFFEDEVRQDLERVEGVAELMVYGGTEREMQVIIDPIRLAAHGLTINDLRNVLAAENVNISAGNLDVGRREYRIRTVGSFSSPEEIERVVIQSTGQHRIRVGDVARVGFGYAERNVSIQHNGQAGIVCAVKAEPGANVLEVTNDTEAAVNQLNETILKENGLYFDWSSDQRPYINGAISLVQQNILIGGLLAICVLLVFLQSASSTVIVAVAIPISVVGTFIFMSALGRNLNVVSLAGISFAVGMLVDNAIVVLENIDRHRSMGKNPFLAAYDGTREVWGAVLASTLTTVAVFLPVVFIEQEAGQLFKDIAIAVTCAITLSLFVSISVIPMLANLFFSRSKRKDGPRGIKVITTIGNGFSRFMMALVDLALKNALTKLITILLLTTISVGSAAIFFPKMEYLPQGNRNLVLSILIPPPGLSLEEREQIGQYIYSQAEPHIKKEADGIPAIHSLFYVGAPDFMLFGATSVHEQRAGELIPMFSRIMNTIPGMFGVSLQAGIFQTSLGKGRTIEVDLRASDLNQLVGGAGALFGTLMGEIPGAQIRPLPSLELLFPEVRLIPDRERLRAAGMSASDLGIAVDVLMDGRKVSEFKEEGKKKVDLVIKAEGEQLNTPEAVYRALIATPAGGTVPVSSLADLVRTYGITQIRHLERQRTVTLQVTPPAHIPLQQAMEQIENDIIPKLAQGPLAGIKYSISGAADKLTQTREALQWNFLLALAITYLLMSALFGNFVYPMLIMFTIPLAAAGGIIGLRLENIFIAPQPMDVLTMLGFIILIGVVVNNAILIVHQSLNNIRELNMEPQTAIRESVRTRLRPIYMSATTSLFGMLPLVVAPGPGSELYRGLGAVVLGGLAISTLFTVFVIPALLSFFIGMEKNSGTEESHS
ncbi:efflux RND transporter permease subunit [Oleidesulfovibrio sp.]|uniref:efflux RND transporter permease subunit n=1 Tax=Oleidesulfovibrio sp. TaxID=2909707 RepID=UPI003A85F871